MTYEDRQQNASIGGEPFHMLSSVRSGGKKGPDHEYPQSNRVFPEDLGGGVHGFSIGGFLIGDDYDRARDRLIAVLQGPSPLRFVSFFGGEWLVTVRNYSLAENALGQGYADLSLSLVLWDQPGAPDAGIDPDAAVTEAASMAAAAAIADFAANLALEGLQDSLVADAVGLAQMALDILDGIATNVDRVSRAAADLGLMLDDLAPDKAASSLQNPLDFAEGLFAVASLVGSALPDPDQLSEAADFDPAAGFLLRKTAERQQQQRNREAIGALLRRSSLVARARALRGRDFSARDDANDALNSLDTALEAEQNRAGGIESWGDDVFQSFGQLRAACRRAMMVKGADLASVRVWPQAVPVPAQLLAYRLYDDVTRADEIIARNDLRHGQVAAGGLSVLSR